MKLLFQLVLICTVLVNLTYCQSEHEKTCLDEKEAEVVGAETDKLYEEAVNITKSYQYVEDSEEPFSGYKQYKSVCLQLKEKVLEIEKLPVLKVCNKVIDQEAYFDEHYNKTEFAENFFEYMCNLQPSEYRSFIYQRQYPLLYPEYVACKALIKEDMPDGSKGSYFNYCSPNVTEVINCFDKVTAGDVKPFIFEITQTKFFALSLKCTESFHEKIYLTNYKNQFTQAQELGQIIGGFQLKRE